MIVGELTPERDAVVRLVVSGRSGAPRSIEAVLDTGFNGALTLTRELADALQLEALGREQVVLATGERRFVRTYRASVRWGGAPKATLVVEAAEPLVGMALLWGDELRMQCTEGGTVEVEALAA